VHDLITGENLEPYKNLLNDVQVKLVHWIDQCSDREMARVMRRKTKTVDFVLTLTDEIIERELRPYIERRLLHCFDLLPDCKTRFLISNFCLSKQKIYLCTFYLV